MFNVLKELVVFPKNQYSFCRSCALKCLKNFQTYSACSVESKTGCVYIDKGFQEVIQHLDRHVKTCGCTSAICTNQGCGLILNKRDLIHLENEVCEFRMLKCHSCKKMTITLEAMEEGMANVEKNMERKKTIETKITNLEIIIADVKTDVEKKHERANNEFKGLKKTVVEAFDEIKDVLVTKEGRKEENTRNVRNKQSVDGENIIVAGGVGKNSVEMFHWRLRRWSPLQSLPRNRSEATSFVYNNHMTIAGGVCDWPFMVDDMIKINIDPNPDLTTQWSDCPVKLPDKLREHSSVLYNDQLLVSGGDNEIGSSDLIKAIQLVPPFTVKTLSRMPERRRCHCMEIFDDNLLIVGGRTTYSCEDNLSSVLQYDVKTNELKQLSPLPYEVSYMATVRWKNYIVVIGGVDKHDKILNTVIIYNVKTEQSHMLPPMRSKRSGCAAVVIGNNIVVLGGSGEQGDLKSVECFNFKRYSWKELPEMSEARLWHTAAVV